MECQVWEFEGDWYVKIDDGVTFCMNQKVTCIEFTKAIAEVKHLKNSIARLVCSVNDELELEIEFEGQAGERA